MASFESLRYLLLGVFLLVMLFLVTMKFYAPFLGWSIPDTICSISTLVRGAISKMFNDFYSSLSSNTLFNLASSFTLSFANIITNLVFSLIERVFLSFFTLTCPTKYLIVDNQMDFVSTLNSEISSCWQKFQRGKYDPLEFEDNPYLCSVIEYNDLNNLDLIDSLNNYFISGDSSDFKNWMWFRRDYLIIKEEKKKNQDMTYEEIIKEIDLRDNSNKYDFCKSVYVFTPSSELGEGDYGTLELHYKYNTPDEVKCSDSEEQIYDKSISLNNGVILISYIDNNYFGTPKEYTICNKIPITVKKDGILICVKEGASGVDYIG